MIKRLPFRTLVVGPHKFNIVLSIAEIESAEQETGLHLNGWFDAQTATICVRPGLSASLCAEVVLHEVMHAVHTYFLPSGAREEEEFVTHYAFGLSTILRQNPKFAHWLLEALTS